MSLLYRLVTPAPPAGYARWASLLAMSRAVRVACLAGLAGVGVAILVALSGGGSRSPPARITTDTPAYCQLLLQRVHQLTRTAPDQARREVTDLADEGRRLCAGGEVRAGLLRLRHAVVLMASSRPKPN
jgi:hypothetical protein